MILPDKDNYGTPDWVYEWANYIYGPFDLDAASSETNKRCMRFFTKEDDALTRAWDAKKVWCNPPYSIKGGSILAWVNKAIKEVVDGNANRVCLLIPADSSTRYYERCYDNAMHIVKFKGRLKFKGAPKNKPCPHPSMLVVFDAVNYGPASTFLKRDQRIHTDWSFKRC